MYPRCCSRPASVAPEAMTRLDLDWVRSQFGQLEDDPEFVFVCNAGGSLVCNQVSSILDHYNRHTRVQPYYPFPPSAQAGEAMDRSRRLWSEAMATDPGELTFGASTSLNTYVLSHAIGHSWQLSLIHI